MGNKLIKSPNIRFAKFTGDWEQRKLKEMLEERNEQIPENDEYPLMSFVQGIGVSPKGDRYDRSFLVKEDKKKYKKTELGDFIYSSNNLETGSIGFNRTGKAVISPVYSIFSSKSERESRFIGIISKRKDFMAKMIRFRQGVVYGQWRIHERDFLDIKITVPKYEEQNKIIDFFDNIDNLITLNQRKLELLKVTKKNMLKKMFHKEGESIPEIRFKGFTDNWEQRKLNKYIETSKDKNSDNLYTKGDVLSVSGTVGIVNQIEFQGRSFAGASVTNYGIVDRGNIVYTKSPLKLNPHGIIKTNKGKPGIVSTLYAVYKAKENTNPNFVHCYFESDYRLNKYLKPLVNKGAKNDMKVSDDNALLGVVTFPSYDEQTKITQLFEAMDNIIVCHQRELNLLEDLKKSMIQQMFI